MSTDDSQSNPGRTGEGPAASVESRIESRLASLRREPDTGARETQVVAPELGNRGEVSATTIGVLLGLATSSDLKLLEGKVDLLSTKLNAVATKLEKVSAVVSNAPTGSDLERIDVQIGALRQMLREALAVVVGSSSASGSGSMDLKSGSTEVREERRRTPRIVTNSEEG